MDVAMQVKELKSHGGASSHGHYGYYHVDKNFMDVAEAEEHGALPGIGGEHEATSVQRVWNAVVGEDSMSEGQQMKAGTEVTAVKKACKRSLTYVLETEDAGFGKTMMGLWLSYGLAKKEGRAFFIDDNNWYVDIRLTSVYSVGCMSRY